MSWFAVAAVCASVSEPEAGTAVSSCAWEQGWVLPSAVPISALSCDTGAVQLTEIHAFYQGALLCPPIS